jgi:hypothetical protein
MQIIYIVLKSYNPSHFMPLYPLPSLTSYAPLLINKTLALSLLTTAFIVSIMLLYANLCFLLNL